MKKRLNFRILLFVFCLAIFGACQNQVKDIEKVINSSNLAIEGTFSLLANSDEIKAINGRLVFANLDVYNKTLSEIGKMTQKQVNDWERLMGFSSLRTYNLNNTQNQQLAEIPLTYASLLNAKGEYQIGSLIAWMHTDGYTYFIEKADEKLLKKVQSSPKNATVTKFPFGTKNIPIKVNSNGLVTTYATIPGNGVDARYQYQYSSGGITYKMVFEVYSYAQPALGIGGWGYSNELLTAVKLEYRQNNGNWAAAGETSTKTIIGSSYTITCNGTTLSGGYFGGSQTTGGQGFYYSFNQSTPIFSNGSPASWNVNISGNYYEYVSVHNQTYNVNPATW